MIGSRKRKLLGFSQKDGGEKQHDVCSAISVSVWKGRWYVAKGANLPPRWFGDGAEMVILMVPMGWNYDYI